MGFTGKQVIHPTQVEVVQRMFSPSESKVNWAVRILVANEKAVTDGRGAWTLDGKMIDAPVIKMAEKLVGFFLYHIQVKKLVRLTCLNRCNGRSLRV